MSILSDRVLREIGFDLIDPYLEDSVQPASIDVHLDSHFYRERSDILYWYDPELSNDQQFEAVHIPQGRSFVLDPHCFALASTYEKVTLPNHILGRFEGKSSLGRLGLLTHITAGFIDPGFEGHITLELRNVTSRPMVLHPGMRIGQICFEMLDSEVENPYGSSKNGSHYQGQRGPTRSRSHQNFKKINVYEGKKV